MAMIKESYSSADIFSAGEYLIDEYGYTTGRERAMEYVRMNEKVGVEVRVEFWLNVVSYIDERAAKK
ncbi:MAG: hypothetical protein WDA07_06155 [Leucobacter sp.]